MSRRRRSRALCFLRWAQFMSVRRLSAVPPGPSLGSPLPLTGCLAPTRLLFLRLLTPTGTRHIGFTACHYLAYYRNLPRSLVLIRLSIGQHWPPCRSQRHNALFFSSSLTDLPPPRSLSCFPLFQQCPRRPVAPAAVGSRADERAKCRRLLRSSRTNLCPFAPCFTPTITFRYRPATIQSFRSPYTTHHSTLSVLRVLVHALLASTPLTIFTAYLPPEPPYLTLGNEPVVPVQDQLLARRTLGPVAKFVLGREIPSLRARRCAHPSSGMHIMTPAIHSALCDPAQRTLKLEAFSYCHRAWHPRGWHGRTLLRLSLH